VQVIYRPLRVAFPLAKDCQGAQVRYLLTPLVNLGALGELKLMPEMSKKQLPFLVILGKGKRSSRLQPFDMFEDSI
jgi:hypothetical protein